MQRSLAYAFVMTIGLAGSAAAAEPLAKSGSFKTQTGFKSIEEALPLGDKHTYAHGVTWGIVSGDGGALRITTAECPYISETAGDTITFRGKCAWSDAEGNRILTDWSGQFSASTGSGKGTQPILGGTGKFSGIQGSAPFQCQALNDKGQFNCSTQWDYQLAH